MSTAPHDSDMATARSQVVTGRTALSPSNHRRAASVGRMAPVMAWSNPSPMSSPIQPVSFAGAAAFRYEPPAPSQFVRGDTDPLRKCVRRPLTGTERCTQAAVAERWTLISAWCNQKIDRRRLDVEWRDLRRTTLATGRVGTKTSRPCRAEKRAAADVSANRRA